MTHKMNRADHIFNEVNERAAQEKMKWVKDQALAEVCCKWLEIAEKMPQKKSMHISTSTVETSCRLQWLVKNGMILYNYEYCDNQERAPLLAAFLKKENERKTDLRDKHCQFRKWNDNSCKANKKMMKRK